MTDLKGELLHSPLDGGKQEIIPAVNSPRPERVPPGMEVRFDPRVGVVAVDKDCVKEMRRELSRGVRALFPQKSSAVAERL